ncbi:hypothetical protein ACS5NO_29650 [Larkinella sp. GY13]|uniref:hypothetical protein n=1 Tax=Larkinella sp. GY13 TaxID=3453720 RepID=UPI003EF00E39
MGSKSSPNRKFAIDVIQLHHATGRQRDELVAKLIHTVFEEGPQSQSAKRRKRTKRRPPDEEQEIQKAE